MPKVVPLGCTRFSKVVLPSSIYQENVFPPSLADGNWFLSSIFFNRGAILLLLLELLLLTLDPLNGSTTILVSTSFAA